MLLDRRRRAGKYLEWKVRLFSAAAVAALAGIFLEWLWLTWIAVALLVAAFALRLLPGEVEESGASEED